jgi:oligopeptide transport system permease protein
MVCSIRASGMREIWGRFRRDVVGMASLMTLFLVASLCFGSLIVAPHPYDAVYPDYVMVPASLVPHPSPAELDAGLRALARRAHMDIALSSDHGSLIVRGEGSFATVGGVTSMTRGILSLLARSDVVSPTGAATPDADSGTLVVGIAIRPQVFVFGTDANGRDLFTRVLVAGRISLAVGLLASVVALGIGVAYGAIAGYVGGRIDGLMMRGVDVVYALPFVFLVIVLLVFFGRSLWLIFLAIGAVEWLDMARIVRGQTLSLKRREFVLAARALGVRDGSILAYHIIPNMSGPIVAYLALMVPRAILAESFLSFLGLGVQEPLTSWGILIADGARHVQGAAHLLVFPASALAVTVVAANQIGEAILRAADGDAR